jgi:hypothetical protein
MKITGPGSGVPPEAVGDPEAAKAADKTAGSKFADNVAAASKPGGVEGQRLGGDAAKVAGVGLTADIGADLQAGRITADIALQRVIDRVLDRQIGANAPPALREQLGAALRQTLEDDPLLADKIRNLAPQR